VQIIDHPGQLAQLSILGRLPVIAAELAVQKRARRSVFVRSTAAALVASEFGDMYSFHVDLRNSYERIERAATCGSGTKAAIDSRRLRGRRNTDRGVQTAPVRKPRPTVPVSFMRASQVRQSENDSCLSPPAG